MNELTKTRKGKRPCLSTLARIFGFLVLINSHLMWVYESLGTVFAPYEKCRGLRIQYCTAWNIWSMKPLKESGTCLNLTTNRKCNYLSNSIPLVFIAGICGATSSFHRSNSATATSHQHK